MGRPKAIQKFNRLTIIIILLVFCLIKCPSISYCDFERSSRVSLITIKGSINPGISKFLERGIKESHKTGADIIVILLDTPGGLVSSLRDMIQTIMDSDIPIVVFVYPSGAQAASAGAILTLSAHIAAMAPGTNIGAAHPVGIGEGKKSKDDNATKKEEKDVVSEKVVNDVAAMVRSIAQERGRNEKWAEDAVRKSLSASANEALELKAIDLIAQDLDDLLKKIDGRQVKVKSKIVTLNTKRYEIIPIKESLRDKILKTIADPNIAYVLLMLGFLGIYFELYHPGSILPGTVGAICLLLALYAMQALPVETTGLLLIILGLVFLFSEVFVQSFGVLGIAGLISLTLGSIMLFDTDTTGIKVSTSIIIPVITTFAIILLFTVFISGKAFLKRPIYGKEAIVGTHAVVTHDFIKGKGKVFYNGEIWNAITTNGDLKKDDIVEIVKISGLTLHVRKIS